MGDVAEQHAGGLLVDDDAQVPVHAQRPEAVVLTAVDAMQF